MIELNINEINKYGITEQPAKYNSEEELIKWLKYDLLQQARKKYKEPNENNIITITDEEEKDYTLNIGKKSIILLKDNEKIKINYMFLFELFIKNFNLNKNIKYILNFNNTIFINDFYLSGYNFENIFCFKNVTLNVKFDIINCNFFNKAQFTNTTFSDISYICKTTFTSTFSFNFVYINKTFIFQEIVFYGDCIFNGSTFNAYILFAHNIFNSHCDLYDTEILNELTIRNSNINKINFFISKISNKINISNNVFNKSENGYNISFNGVYLNNNENSIINIINLKKEDGCSSTISFENSNLVKGNVIINNMIFKEINLKGSLGNINFINTEINKITNSETARILKNEELKKVNYIKALEYQAEETRLHKEELKEQFKENKNLKTFGDILSIELSSLYSDNGQNWIRAFICTILFPSVFFTLSYNIYNIPIFIFVLISFLFIPLCDNTKITKYIFISMFTYLILFIPIQNYIFSILIDIDNKTFIKELLSYITPTNFNQIILDKTNESYIYKDNTIIRAISYFLGKVLFWYGSVQTVTAFRKFSKGA